MAAPAGVRGLRIAIFSVLMSNEEKIKEAQTILEEAFKKIRALGLAPRFRWGRTVNGEKEAIAANISDFRGFHVLPTDND